MIYDSDHNDRDSSFIRGNSPEKYFERVEVPVTGGKPERKELGSLGDTADIARASG